MDTSFFDLPLFNLLLVIWSILCIILFFKIWGATNNIAHIRKTLDKLAKNFVEEPKDAKEQN